MVTHPIEFEHGLLRPDHARVFDHRAELVGAIHVEVIIVVVSRQDEHLGGIDQSAEPGEGIRPVAQRVIRQIARHDQCVDRAEGR